VNVTDIAFVIAVLVTVCTLFCMWDHVQMCVTDSTWIMLCLFRCWL